MPEYKQVSRIRQKNNKLIRHSTSDRVSICEYCGKPFTQTWSEKYQAYSNFKLCHSCRKTHSRNGINVSVEYEPHWGQRLVHESKARFKCLSCGVRWGKDRCSIMEGIEYFIKCLNEDRDSSVIPHALMWIVAPTDKIARQNWRELLHNIPKEIVTDVSKATQTIETINGGIIEVHSAYDPESLVAVGLDFVIITEAARIPDLESVWSNIEGRLNSPGRGLKGKGGHAIINSSPLGKNFFYKMWAWGQEDTSQYDPSWESWQFRTWDNPYMAKRGNEIQKNGHTYEENLRHRMPDKRYQQDYLGEFISDINAVYTDIDKCFVKLHELPDEEQKNWITPDPLMTYTIGYDPGGAVDDPVVLIRDETGKVAKIDMMKGLGWEAQWDRIEFYSRYYNDAIVNFGKTGLGETIQSQFEKRGIPCNPYNEQGRNKEKLVEKSSIIVKQEWCKIPWSQETENQFKDYISIMRKSGSTEYRNGSNDGHDDIVSAFYFAFADFDMIEEEMPFVGLMGGVSSKSNQYDSDPKVVLLEKKDKKDSKDLLLEMCIKQGYVSKGCRLSGQMVFMLVNTGKNPCDGCAFAPNCKKAIIKTG